ncbi:hypothetical protein EVAR_47949_1 [Eumeta japonica]|uniref:Uncharacterized protein n=1 Tax=Eumeta variegata TaxID=151549 RepID=A0A4C1X8M1_EUMVA|nr:hypothetical protein EVAR_47949_1 [Eumeta japonica]
MRLRLRRKLVGRAAAPPARPRGVQVSVFYSVDRNVNHETRAADRPSVYPFAYTFVTLNVIEILISYSRIFDKESSKRHPLFVNKSSSACQALPLDTLTPSPTISTSGYLGVTYEDKNKRTSRDKCAKIAARGRERGARGTGGVDPPELLFG